MRGVSTVVDATLFLLILGVAVATVVGVPMVVGGVGAGSAEATGGPNGVDHADAVAEHLASGTTRVEYSLAPAAGAIDGDPPIEIRDGPPFARSAHGTIASLLADAAVATMSVDGDAISVDGETFEAAVVAATERRIARDNVSVGVTAAWEPYPGASIAGRSHAGERPPPTVDVRAATVVVEGPIPASRQRALAAAEERGFEGVASVVADAVVAGLFPPDRTRLALRGGYPTSALVANRYAQARRAFGGNLAAPTVHADVEATNAELAATLADRIERDLREQYGTPAAAARNVSTGTVTITVRTWPR